MTASSTAVYDAAVLLLGNLTNVVASRAPLVTAGIVPHLVRSLSSDSEQLQHLAAGALGNLACGDPSNKLRIVAAGAVEPLIKLLTSDSEEVQESAVTAFGNLLACDNSADVQAMLVSSGAAVVPLVHLLLHCNSEKALEQAIRILLTLTSGSGSHTRAIAAAGGVPPLVQLLHSASARLQFVAVSLLHLIALEGTPSNLIAMEAAGAVPILTKLQGESKNGFDLRVVISDLLERLSNCVERIRYRARRSGSANTGGSIGSGSANDPGDGSGVPPPSIPSSESALAPFSVLPVAASAAVGGKKLCWACGAAVMPLKKCSVCTVAAYCSGACQKADWKAHKGQCAGLKASAAAFRE